MDDMTAIKSTKGGVSHETPPFFMRPKFIIKGVSRETFYIFLCFSSSLLYKKFDKRKDAV